VKTRRIVRGGLTVALVTVGFLAFCLIVIALVTMTWWAPVG